MSVFLSEKMAEAFYGLHADIRADGHSEYWLSGGRGSGKSSFVAMEILLGLMKNRDANAIVYRKVAATLRESVMEQMLWAADQLGIGQNIKIKLSAMEIVLLPGGQRILFRGADDPGKAKGIKLRKGFFGYLWFEELAEFAGMEDVRSIKASVLRGSRGAKTFYTYNPPPGGRHWVNREALTVREDRIGHHSTYLDMPRKWLGEDFIAEAEAMRNANERVWRQVYLGESAGNGAQVFENVRLRTISGQEIEGMERFACGLDFGFAVDPDAFVKVCYAPGEKRLFVTDEFCGVRVGIDRLAEEVAERANAATVRCDSADPRMIQELRSRGINAVGAKKGPGSVEHGIRWLQERAEIVIDPKRCPWTAKEFCGYEYDTDGDGNFIAEYPDRDNHMIDAARYALENVIGAREARTLNKKALGI